MWQTDKSKEELLAQLAEVEGKLKDAEEDIRWLREENEVLNSIVEESTDGILLIDQQGLIVKYNKEMERITGRGREEILGKHALEFYPLANPNNISIDGLKKRGILLNRYLQGNIPSVRKVVETELIKSNGVQVAIQDIPFSIKTSKGYMVCSMIRDITLQREAQEEIKQQLAFIQELIDTVPSPIYYKDINGIYKGCNQAFKEYVGLSREEIIGKTVYDLCPTELAELSNKKNNEILSSGGQQRYRGSFRYADGSNHDVIVHKGTYCDVSGHLQGIVGVLIDITEEKRLERELLKSNYKITQMLESITDGFFVLDTEWNFTYLNQEAINYFYKVKGIEELLGKSFFDIVPRFSYTAEQYNIAVSNNIAINFEAQPPYSDGWVEINAYPTGDGLSVFFRDITKRKKTEFALRSSEERFFKIFNKSPFPMVIKDVNLKVVEVNDKYLQLSGYERSEVIGRSVDIFCTEPSKLIASQKVIETGCLVNFEANYFTKQQEERTALFSCEKIELDGQTHILEVCNDITELRQYEKEMVRLERLNVIGKMAGTLAHEVRQPITSLRGFLQLLGEKEQYSEHKQYFDFMISELDRTNAIITNFLTLAKNKKSEPVLCKLNQIIKELYPLLEADALNTDINLLSKVADTPEVLLDKKEINQLILNLVRNAFEETRKGDNVVIGTFVQGEEVVLYIKDKGKGIESGILDKLGTPFLTTKPEGTGLGLATCYSIAERHNATIDVDTSSEGTTFFVKFKK